MMLTTSGLSAGDVVGSRVRASATVSAWAAPPGRGGASRVLSHARGDFLKLFEIIAQPVDEVVGNLANDT